MSKLIAMALGAALIVFGLSRAGAESADPITPQQFVEKAGIAGMYEVEAGQLAQERAASGDVKAFAATMVKDHSAAGEELKATAGDIPVPTQLDAPHQALLDQLKAASATSFDKLYVDQQVEAHKDAVALFTNYSTQGPNGALKAFAGKTLPTLQHHQMMVGTLKSSTP